MKQCKQCGVIIHKLCRLDKSIKCKIVTEQKEMFSFHDDQKGKMRHHQFVQGNLPLNSVCAKCKLICADYFSLEGYSCLWCQKKYHPECIQESDQICEFDNLENVILRPYEVKYTKIIEKIDIIKLIKKNRPFKSK